MSPLTSCAARPPPTSLPPSRASPSADEPAALSRGLPSADEPAPSRTARLRRRAPALSRGSPSADEHARPLARLALRRRARRPLTRLALRQRARGPLARLTRLPSADELADRGLIGGIVGSETLNRNEMGKEDGVRER
jgi:hypothetical protein